MVKWKNRSDLLLLATCVDLVDRTLRVEDMATNVLFPFDSVNHVPPRPLILPLRCNTRETPGDSLKKRAEPEDKDLHKFLYYVR